MLNLSIKPYNKHLVQNNKIKQTICLMGKLVGQVCFESGKLCRHCNIHGQFSLSKQLSLFRLHTQCSSNYWAMRCEKHLHLTMQKKLSYSLCLSQAEPPSFSPQQNKSLTPLSPSICWSCWAKEWQTVWQRVSSSGEEVHYSSSNPAVHQTGDSSGISYFAGVPSLLKGFLQDHFHIWSTSVNQSTHRAPVVYRTPLFISTGEQEMTFTWQIEVRQIIGLPCF